MDRRKMFMIYSHFIL